jgi:GAF domain-containing protein
MSCPRCRQDTPRGAKFCPDCGASLGASAPRPLPTAVEPILSAIAKMAARLCDARDAQILLVDGSTLRLVAQHGSLRTTRSLGEPFPLSPGTVHGRAALERRVIHVRDLKAVVRTQYPELTTRQRATGIRTMLAAPLLSEGTAIGVIAIRRLRVRPFSAKQIALLGTFADQAALAIEKSWLSEERESRNRDLTEALEQRTATAEILRVISSSPTDLQPVFDTIARSACRLCNGTTAAVFLVRDATIHHPANYGGSPEALAAARARYPRPLGMDTGPGIAILTRSVYEVRDVEDPSTAEHIRAVGRVLGFRSVITVPMLREGEAIGAIAVTRGEPGPFSEGDMALLQTFADQAVIAIENVRLFTEVEARNRDLTEALDQQTATSEILRVISSSPTSVEAVFDTILANALRLCETPTGGVFTFDGKAFHLAAAAHWSDEFLAALQAAVILPGPETPLRRVGLSREVSHVADIFADPSFSPPEAYRLEGMRTSLAVPMLKEGRLIGALTFHRREVRPFTEQQIALIKTFADQAVIAIENVRLFKELEARNRELTAALEQQTATSEMLRVISGSPTDLQPVFDTIVQSTVRLCGASVSSVLRLVDGMQHLVANHGLNPQWLEEARRVYPQPLRPNTISGLAILERRIVHVPNVEVDERFPQARALARIGRYRSVVFVPMLREGVPIGAISVGKEDPFSDSQIVLLKTFADQAVIAIENVRLFKELEARNRDLTNALDQQTATSDVLRIIAQSPTELRPVLDAIATSAVRLCAASDVVIERLEGDRFYNAAHAGTQMKGLVGHSLPLTRRFPGGRAVLDRRPVIIDDIMLVAESEYPDTLELLKLNTVHSCAEIPLLSEGKSLGNLAVLRAEVRPFTEGEIALLQTFADQAVIAIENVRLFKELEMRNRDLTDALEQQTATSEILRAIAHTQTDAQPVFDTIVRSATRLCHAAVTAVFLTDRGMIYHPASYGGSPEALAAINARFPRPLDRETAAGTAILTRSVVHVPDVQEPSAVEFVRQTGRAVGFRSLLSVPMLRQDEAVGAINVTRREPGHFSDAEVELLKTFADQAVIAIENVRLFKELQARTTELTRSVEQLTALGEVSRAVSSTLDVETVLSTVVSRARDLAGADGCLIYEYDAATQQFHVRATDNLDAEFGEAMRRMPIGKGEGVSGRAAEIGEPVQVADITQPGIYASSVRDVVIRAGYRAALSVPLLREDEVIGSLILIRKTPGEFSAEIIEALKTFATQSALAIQNARLFHEIEDKGRQLEVASRHKSQFLANMSHELRTPLNAILGYTELLLDGIYGALPEKAGETMARIDRSGRHLLALINDVLDLSKIEAGQLTLSLTDYSLTEVIHTVVTAVEPLAAEKGLGLRVALEPDLPLARGDDRRISQVLLNLVGNAVKFADAGEVRIEARVSDGSFLISVSDTGPGIATEDQGRIFEEFQQADTSNTRKKGGTGLGLSIAKRILALHGGRIWVESALGKGSTFFFMLPVRVQRMAEVR